MNKEKTNNPSPSFPQRSKQYTALFELQDFLEKEVQDASPGAFYRSFTPLTEGLGLESPKLKATPEAPEKDLAQSANEKPAPQRRMERKLDIEMLFDEPIFMVDSESVPKVSEILSTSQAPKTSGVPVNAILEAMAPGTLGKEADLKSVIAAEPQKPETEAPQTTTPVATPPKLPKISVTKRLLAALVDQLFVLTLWAIAIVITSNALNGFQSGFSVDILKEFSTPAFQRFAVLEFSALWIGYFAISLGIMDLTFGMWVWGLRVSYGNPEDSQYWMRRMMRVIWSFIFFAPVIPSLLLAFRRKGRNLLDVLSGTNLYVTA